MARARENPQAWSELLISLGNDDVKTARRIASECGFDKDPRASMYSYYCKLPSGKVLPFGSARKVADFLGLSPATLRDRVRFGNLNFKVGRLKGYEVWREKMGETQPRHYKDKSGKDLFDKWYQEYEFNEFRAIMEAIAERYIKRNKDRLNDLEKAIETLRRLKEYEEMEVAE